MIWNTVYPKKYAHGFYFVALCCGYILTDFPISIRLTSLALWQSNDCPSASKATLMNMDNYFMWIHYERLHNHNKAKHNKTVCIFLGIYCTMIYHSHTEQPVTRGTARVRVVYNELQYIRLARNTQIDTIDTKYVLKSISVDKTLKTYIFFQWFRSSSVNIWYMY